MSDAIPAPDLPDTPVADAAVSQAPEVTQDTPTETPSYFDEKFDRSSLAPELLPAYNELHSSYTKKTQEIAEQRKQFEQHQEALAWLETLQTDPATQRQLYEELQELFAEESEEADESDFEAETEEDVYQDPRFTEFLEALEAEKAAEAEQEALQGLLETVETEFSSIEESVGRKLTDAEKDFVVAQAVTTAQQTQSELDIKAAFEALSGIISESQQRYIASKKSPTVVGNGQAGDHTPDLSDPRVRQKFMAELAEGLGA